MPVASSAFTLDPVVQADGRRYVRETHTLTVGSPFLVDYLAAAGTNYTTVMNGRVAGINEQLAQAEYMLCVEGNTFTTSQQTATELAARFRAEYLNASRERVCRMAYWLIERINAGSFTDTQARTAFGLATTPWNTLKSTRLTPQHDAWAAVIAATGA
jgi:hypothetical protein